jgi:tetratricopeptide (TPR) repeat protein
MQGNRQKMRIRKTIAVGLGAIGFLAIAVAMSAEGARFTDRSTSVSDLLTENGISFVQKSELDSAISSFEQAIVANPQNARAYSYLGFTHHESGNLRSAQKYFGIALEIDPNQIHALRWGGAVDLAGQDLESAKIKLQRLSRVCGPSCSEYEDLRSAVQSFKVKD